jgi:predicted O-methyltransferase YrrM
VSGHDRQGVSSEVLLPEGRQAWRLTAAVARRRLRVMERRGLPDSLRAPLRFLVERSLGAEDARVTARVEAIRADLAARAGESAGVFADGDGRAVRRSLTEVAHLSSVLPVWGTFLYLCARASGARTILELGTAAGISGCYLASAPSCRRFITVEGSAERSRLARQHLDRITTNYELVTAPFDDALERILPALDAPIDLLYIDGSKRAGENLRLFERIAPSLGAHAVAVFDDITWSRDLWRDWQELARRPGWSHVIDAGRFGIGVRAAGPATAARHALWQFAGVDLYRARQMLGRALHQERGA